MSDVAINQPPRGNYTNGMDRILSMPRCSVLRAGVLSVANATATPIPWDTRDYDTDGMTATLGSRITALTAGLYLFCGWLVWAANATGFREIYLQKTQPGAIVTQFGDGLQTPSSSAVYGQEITKQIQLNAGDYVELVAAQNSGGGLGVVQATGFDRENGFQACCISL